MDFFYSVGILFFYCEIFEKMCLGVVLYFGSVLLVKLCFCENGLLLLIIFLRKMENGGLGDLFDFCECICSYEGVM